MAENKEKYSNYLPPLIIFVVPNFPYDHKKNIQ